VAIEPPTETATVAELTTLISIAEPARMAARTVGTSDAASGDFVTDPSTDVVTLMWSAGCPMWEIVRAELPVAALSVCHAAADGCAEAEALTPWEDAVEADRSCEVETAPALDDLALECQAAVAGSS
jgi:hypothetical protein